MAQLPAYIQIYIYRERERERERERNMQKYMCIAAGRLDMPCTVSNM